MTRLKSENYVDQLIEILNKTNFSNTEYKSIVVNVYNSLYQGSKSYLIILISVLMGCSIIGSLVNIYVIFIFKCIFKISFSRKKKTATETIESLSIDQLDSKRKFHHNPNHQTLSFKHLKSLIKHVDSNSNLKFFYRIIFYLIIVDLFTCSIAIPITVYEIFNNMMINEFFCKLFEFIRGFGVISSNFMIILIAIERYMALYNKNEIKSFNLRIIFLSIITFIISIICMLQVSVYQKHENSAVFIGVCLKSDYLFDHKMHRLINILVTSIFAIGSIFVSIIYLVIFIKIFKINSQDRKVTKESLIVRVPGTDSINKTIETENCNEITTIELNNEEAQSDTSFNLVYFIRLAFTILLVTIIYYLSIIPWCLTINGIIEYNPYLHYTFLLNQSVNPFIYLFLNPHFRSCGFYLLKTKLKHCFSCCS